MEILHPDCSKVRAAYQVRCVTCSKVFCLLHRENTFVRLFGCFEFVSFLTVSHLQCDRTTTRVSLIEWQKIHKLKVFNDLANKI